MDETTMDTTTTETEAFATNRAATLSTLADTADCVGLVLRSLRALEGAAGDLRAAADAFGHVALVHMADMVAAGAAQLETQLAGHLSQVEAQCRGMPVPATPAALRAANAIAAQCLAAAAAGDA